MSESGWHAARESWVAQQERRLCICNDDAVVDASHTLIGINSMRHHLTHSPHRYSHGVKAANPCQSRNSASRMGRWHADSLAACRTHPPGRTRSAKAITFWPIHRRRPVSVLLYSCRCPLPLQAQAATFCFLPLGSAFCALTAAAPGTVILTCFLKIEQLRSRGFWRRIGTQALISSGSAKPRMNALHSAPSSDARCRFITREWPLSFLYALAQFGPGQGTNISV
jgi:hypothetical protein